MNFPSGPITSALCLASVTLVAASLGFAAWARTPAPPQVGEGLVLDDYGIYCRPKVVGREEAPGTQLGYINNFSETPRISFRQQLVPAALDVSFGVVFTPEHSVAGATMHSWKPGATEPEVWYADYHAGQQSSRGFTFEYPEELILGTWRLEAWDDQDLLYSVEFEVVPAATLPQVLSYCNPTVS